MLRFRSPYSINIEDNSTELNIIINDNINAFILYVSILIIITHPKIQTCK